MLTTTDKSKILSYSQKFRRFGMATITDLLDKSTITAVKIDAERLLKHSAERRGSHLATTGYRPR